MPAKKKEQEKLENTYGNPVSLSEETYLYNEEDSIKKDFWAATLDNTHEILEQYSRDANLDLSKRIEYLKAVNRIVNQELEDIIPQVPDKAPALWRERPKSDRYMSPCDFTIKHYPSLGFGLTQADLTRLDAQLLAALRNWRDKHSWPDGFDLPSQVEANSRRLQEMSDNEIEEVKKLGEMIRTRQLRNKM